MAYSDVVEMSVNASLRERVAAAAAGEKIADPIQWAADNMWHIASSPGWADAWDYAEDTKNENVNQDTGQRTDVISDAMILSSVQARIAELQAPPA
jgi:hypothetical protein